MKWDVYLIYNQLLDLARLDYNAKAIKLEHSITDHYPIFLSLKIKNNDKKNTLKNIINYNKQNKLCKYTNWYEIYNINDVNIATDFLVSNIKNIITLLTKTIVSKNRNKARKSWITNGLTAA